MSRRRTPHPPALHEQSPPYHVGQRVPPAPDSQSPSPASTSTPEPHPTCLDLFCGCGGFTLGMQRAGFHVLAAIDFNPQAVATLRANLAERHHPELIPVAHALERDLTRFAPADLAALLFPEQPPTAGHLPSAPLTPNGQSAIGHRQSLVDVIVVGPPCQGFSTVRQRDGANHGLRLIQDPRRHLYREFLRYVDFFQPKLFVMENVLGLRTAAGGAYFTAVQQEARAHGYRVHGQIENAWALGVPQKRRRQLIIGVRGDLPGYFLPELQPAPRAVGAPHSGAARSQHRAVGPEAGASVLWDAIGDLPALRAGSGRDECDYDLDRFVKHLDAVGKTAANYLFDVLEVDRAPRLTNHVARPHSDRNLRDFKLLHEGENSAVAKRERGVEFEFPYDKSTFKDRYTRQSRWKPCSTIVAHLSRDGLMFIHPTQNRSLTPREAARIQSFPDWFRFPNARTHVFRLIGNAVPPLVGEAVGLTVRAFLTEPRRSRREEAHSEARTPECGLRNESQSLLTSSPTRTEAARELERLARLDHRELRALPKADFLRGWHALLFLFPGLHPDNARDHGGTEEIWPEAHQVLPELEEAQPQRYARSGWLVKLEIVGNPALN